MAQRWSAGRSHAWWPDTAAGNRKRNMGSGDKWQHEPWWSWPGSGVSWEASTPAWDYEDWGIEAGDPEEYSPWAAQRSTESVGRSACKHFLQGRCQWGNACRFAHGPTDGPAPAEPVQLASGTASDPYEAGEVAYIAEVPPDGDSHVCEGSHSPRSQSSLPAFAPVPPESALAASEQHEVQSSPRDREDTEVSHVEDALAEEDVAKVPKATRRHPRKPPPRLWCQILLHKPHQNFDLIPMLIGRGGCNMREIHQATKAKVRIRGKGSGYYEVDGEREAPVPLMVVVTSDSQDADGFKEAVRMTLARLHDVSKRYRMFCQDRGLHCNSNEQLFSIGEHSWGSEELLGEELSSVSVSSRDRGAAEGGQRGGSKNRGNRSGDGADSSGRASGAKTKRRDAHGSESASPALGATPMFPFPPAPWPYPGMPFFGGYPAFGPFGPEWAYPGALPYDGMGFLGYNPWMNCDADAADDETESQPALGGAAASLGLVAQPSSPTPASHDGRATRVGGRAAEQKLRQHAQEKKDVKQAQLDEIEEDDAGLTALIASEVANFLAENDSGLTQDDEP